MRYVISDTHFEHGKIIGYENRPFSTVEKMDEHIIAAWNSVVKKKDTIFHLGDFAFTTSSRIKILISRLRGIKHLIMGSHDRNSCGWWREAGFKEVYKYPIIIDKFFILSHKPVYLNENMPYVNIHGHIHSKTLNLSQYINVSVEHTDYAPVNLDKIIEKLS